MKIVARRFRDCATKLKYVLRHRLPVEARKIDLLLFNGGRPSLENALKSFERFAVLRGQAERPFSHLIFSAAPDDVIDSRLWQAIVRDALNDIGLDPDERPLLICRHFDGKVDHVHVVVCRVSTAGDIWNRRLNVPALAKMADRIESKFFLSATGNAVKDGLAPCRELVNINRARTRLGVGPLTASDLIDLVDASSAKAMDLPSFLLLCGDRGLMIKGSDTHHGLVFVDAHCGHKVALSKVTNRRWSLLKILEALGHNQTIADKQCSGSEEVEQDFWDMERPFDPDDCNDQGDPSDHQDQSFDPCGETGLMEDQAPDDFGCYEPPADYDMDW